MKHFSNTLNRLLSYSNKMFTALSRPLEHFTPVLQPDSFDKRYVAGLASLAMVKSSHKYRGPQTNINFINKVFLHMNLVCNCGVALFHFVLSYLPLASNPSQRERTTLDSWLRLVARGFIRWSTFQKLKTKNFFWEKTVILARSQ